MDGTKATDLDPETAAFLRARIAYHEQRGHVLIAHLPWLDRVARRAMSRLPRNVNLDDVKSEAVDAMLNVIEVWDPLRGPLIPFATKRVFGAIADWARRTR